MRRDPHPVLHRLRAFVPVAVFGAWIAIVTGWTHGFTAFTSFSAAVEAAGSLPRPAPQFALIDQEGRHLDLGARESGYRLVQVMYLGCHDACPVAMARLQDVVTALADVPVDRLRAVSVSADRDSPAMLRSAWERFGSPPNWSFATPAAGSGDEAFRELGVWVHRRSDGLINHGVDIFLIDPDGQVVAILPAADDPARLTAAVREAIG